jgi:hypothetical protein
MVSAIKFLVICYISNRKPMNLRMTYYSVKERSEGEEEEEEEGEREKRQGVGEKHPLQGGKLPGNGSFTNSGQEP